MAHGLLHTAPPAPHAQEQTMLQYARTHPWDAPRFLPARCLRCGSSTFMAVRRLESPPEARPWQVFCRQCQGWSPGYPLAVSRKG